MSTKPENVIDLEAFRSLYEEPDLKTLTRLSGKMAEHLVGVGQMLSNVQSQVNTLVSRVEVSSRYSSLEEGEILSRLSNLEKRVSEVGSVLLQIADHLGVPHD